MPHLKKGGEEHGYVHNLTEDEPSTEISSFYGFPSAENTLLESMNEKSESSGTSMDDYLSAQSQPTSPGKIKNNLG